MSIAKSKGKVSKSIVMGVIAVLVLSAIFAILPFRSKAIGETYPTLYIKIHRIREIDDIEGVYDQPFPEWYYEIKLYNGEEWKSITHVCKTGEDIIVDETHSFEVYTSEVTIQIKLMDEDTSLFDHYDDLADISGHIGGGTDDDTSYKRGAIYIGYYNLKTGLLTGDKTYVEEGYVKTSGEYDGSIDVDENDAEVYFKIWDNYESPKADAGSDKTVHTGDLVNFDASGSSASSGSSLTRYQWDFNGDGKYDAEGETVSYTYNKGGTYTVHLKVTDSIGETDTDTCKVAVTSDEQPPSNRLPTAHFTYSPSSPDVDEAVSFDGSSSSDSDGWIVSYEWDWNDDGVYEGSGKTTTHSWSSSGDHSVTLRVTDNDGDTDIYTKTITVRKEGGIPGFEFAFLIIAIASIILLKRKKNER